MRSVTSAGDPAEAPAEAPGIAMPSCGAVGAVAPGSAPAAAWPSAAPAQVRKSRRFIAAMLSWRMGMDKARRWHRRGLAGIFEGPAATPLSTEDIHANPSALSDFRLCAQPRLRAARLELLQPRAFPRG